MEHPFTWYSLLAPGLQHLIPEHTFFALVAAALLILIALRARAALAQPEEDPVVPSGRIGTRNIAELIVQLIVSQSDTIIGTQGRKYVPFFGTFFAFILLSNLIGLLPGFAAPTANLNTTLGLALVSFFGYNLIGLREQGVTYLRHFFGPMTSLPGGGPIAKLAFIPVLLISVAFFFILELFSHGFRPVSLSLRLFGNMMGDHQVIEAFIELTKVLVPVAFYALGTLVSLIQAFVFTLLSMIYVALAISHGPGEEGGHESHH